MISVKFHFRRENILDKQRKERNTARYLRLYLCILGVTVYISIINHMPIPIETAMHTVYIYIYKTDFLPAEGSCVLGSTRSVSFVSRPGSGGSMVP